MNCNQKRLNVTTRTSLARDRRCWLLDGKIQWSILIVGALIFLTTLAGCASHKSGADHTTLKQTDSHVSWEMSRFRNAEIWGHLTADQKQQGNAAYNSYKTAFDEAVRAANGNKHAPTPDNVEAAANEAIRVLSTLPTEQR